jgi:hypothetical protein
MNKLASFPVAMPQAILLRPFGADIKIGGKVTLV